jgi:diacylglycerol kinase family enzyme
MERHKRVTVIINPLANHGRAREVVPIIKQAFPDARVFVTKEAGDAEKIAGSIEKSAGVIAAGGDGTVSEIVNGLASADKLDIPLGVIPCGSGNDFCKTAGLPLAFDAAVKAVQAGLKAGLTRQLDLGCVNGRYYANSLAAGFDARVAHVANAIKEETQKKRANPLSHGTLPCRVP